MHSDRLVHIQGKCVQKLDLQQTVMVSELRKIPQMSTVALREHMQAKKKKIVLRQATFSYSLDVAYSFIQRSSAHFDGFVCFRQAFSTWHKTAVV